MEEEGSRWKLMVLEFHMLYHNTSLLYDESFF